MSIETTLTNSSLIQEQVQQLLVQPLQQASTFLSAGPTILDSNSPVRIPRIAAGTTAGFVGEGQLISDGSVTFDEIDALPSTLQSIKVWLPVSNELLRGSAVNGLEQILRTRLLTDVAYALDEALWDGKGTNNTIKGIFQQSGVQTGTLDLTNPDTLIDALATAQGNFVSPSHWVMTAESFAALRKLKVGTGDARYIFDPSTVQDGTAFQLFGLPVIITETGIPPVGVGSPAVNKNRVALVDFSKVAVVRDTAASVFIADQTLAQNDSVAIRITTRYDVALLQPKGVTILQEA